MSASADLRLNPASNIEWKFCLRLDVAHGSYSDQHSKKQILKMAKKAKLLNLLDAEKGRDFEAQKRKKQVKAAERRKRQKTEHVDDNSEIEEETPNGSILNGTNGDFEAFGSDNSNAEDGVIPQPDVAAEASASEAEQDSDLELSDLEEEDREDVVPHQRMTINNGPALTASRKRIAVVSDKPKHPFHWHNSLVSTHQKADELIPDAMDDETRELMFYKIARDATITARGLFKKENVPFSRPTDYFAEMVKTEDHMGRVKKKLYDEAANKKASEEARKLRDAKKFGKQVQVAKEQERAKEKRTTLNKIQELKRSGFVDKCTDSANMMQNERTMILVELQKVMICLKKSTSMMIRRKHDETDRKLRLVDKRKIRNMVLVVRKGSPRVALQNPALI